MTEHKARIKKRFFSYWCCMMQREILVAAAVFAVLFLWNRFLGGGMSDSGQLVGSSSWFPVLFAYIMLQLTSGRGGIMAAISFGSTRKEAVCSYQLSRLLAVAELSVLYGIFCIVWHCSTGTAFYASEMIQAVMWLFFAVGIAQLGCAVIQRYKESGLIVVVLTMAIAVVTGAVLQAVDAGNVLEGFRHPLSGLVCFIITAVVYVSGCIAQQKSIKKVQV